MYEYVIGIDPGLQGGVAIYCVSEKTMVACPMPVYAGRVDLDALKDVMAEMAAIVYIEEQWARFPDSRTGAMTMGRMYEPLFIACEDLNLPYELVTPSVWQDVLFVDYDLDEYGPYNDDNKIVAIDHVSYHWPSVDLHPGMQRGPHDGICDSVCIAEYGAIEEGYRE
jgi:hypothetical protein